MSGIHEQELYQCPDCGLGVTGYYRVLHPSCPNCRMDTKLFVKAIPEPGKLFWTEENPL